MNGNISKDGTRRGKILLSKFAPNLLHMSSSFKRKSIYMSISDDVNTKPAPAVASREKKIADPAKTSSTLNKSRVKMKKEKQANTSGRRRRRHK